MRLKHWSSLRMILLNHRKRCCLCQILKLSLHTSGAILIFLFAFLFLLLNRLIELRFLNEAYLTIIIALLFLLIFSFFINWSCLFFKLKIFNLFFIYICCKIRYRVSIGLTYRFLLDHYLLKTSVEIHPISHLILHGLSRTERVNLNSWFK